MNDIKELCDIIRETSFRIHKYLKSGHLEKVYENALLHRLRKLGLEVRLILQDYCKIGTVM